MTVISFVNSRNLYQCLRRSVIGSDGCIRVWDLWSLFHAEPSDRDELDSAFYRMDPMNEVEVEAGAILTSITRSRQKGDQNIWFIQV